MSEGRAGQGEGQRIALVTGGTGAIGEAIVRGLCARGFSVITTARSEAKGAATTKRIQEAVPGAEVRALQGDVSTAAGVTDLRAHVDGPLHVLVNNAAECPKRREETEEGVERQWATNVLGYYRMILAFEDLLAASAPARVVNVASYWAGGLDLDDPEFVERRYDNDSAYRQSKQADRMITAGLAERLATKGITINACHPGDVPSKLARDLGFGGSSTPEQGAATPLFLAADASVEGETGGYYARSRREDDPFTRDPAEVERLLLLCASYAR